MSEPLPKKTKFITSFFKRNESSSSSSPFSAQSVCTPVTPHIDDPPVSSIPEPENDDNALERDPGLRTPIWQRAFNVRDKIRKEYCLLGPFQPDLEIPLSEQGGQQRKFQSSWYKDFSWLEYSVAKDKAYCFPCYLFDTESSKHRAFTVDGFRNWKRVCNGDPKFKNLECIADLCHMLVQTRKSEFYPMIYRLMCLVLTIPVSTATTERAFSTMNIVKNRLRSKMEDEFLDDCMVLHIEKEYADSIDNAVVIEDFESLSNRRVKFS